MKGNKKLAKGIWYIGICLLVLCVVGMTKINSTSIGMKKVVVQAATKKQKNAAFNKKAKKAYKKFLKDMYENRKAFTFDGKKYTWNSSWKYAIVDINNDQKLELQIFNVGRPEYYLFLYYKGKVKCIDIAPYHSCFCRLKKGKIYVVSSANNGSEDNALMQIKDGKVKCLGYVFQQNEYTGSGSEFNILEFRNGKGKRISKKAFEKILKKYTGITDYKQICDCYAECGKKTQLKEEVKWKTYK